MIVICINDNWITPNIFIPKPKNTPVKDTLYEVTDEEVCKCGCGASMFILKEFGDRIGWLREHFSEVDINIEDIEHVEVLEETI